MKIKTLLACAFLLITSVSFTAPKYDRMILFGDSLSDIGNNQWANHDTRQPWTADIDGAPVTNYVDGHPGKIWAQDLVADSALFQSKKIIASTNPAIKGDASKTTDSVDYAWASAISKRGYANDMGYKLSWCKKPAHYAKAGVTCVPGALEQVKRYLAQNKVDKESLYVIWIGGNDLFNNSYFVRDTFLNPSHFKNDFASISWRPSHNVIEAARMLHHAGVPSSHIALINLPDLTKAPIAEQVLHGHPFLTLLTRATVETFNFNLWFKNKLQRLFYRNHFQYVDIFPLLNQVVKNPRAFGFDHVTQECVLNHDAYFSGCKGYLFYNGKHPSTQAGKIVAGYIAKRLK